MTGNSMAVTGTAALVTGLVLGGVCAYGVWRLFRSGFRAGRRVERGVHRVVRIGTVLAAAGAIGAVIVAVQWTVLRPAVHPAAVGIVLGMPGIFAGLALARFGAIAVTASHHRAGRHGARRGGKRGGRR